MNRVLLAWAVHTFTASGAVLGFLALLSASEGQFRIAFAWLAVSLIVDGIDGLFARAVNVEQVLPGFDGGLIDLVIDYLTYVVVPAFILFRAELLPREWCIPGVAAILLASLYHYGRTDIKSKDWYFQGFPAFWNIVIFYLYVCMMSQFFNLGLVALFVALTFTPGLWIHPLRSAEWRRLNVPVTCAWAAINLAILAYLPTRLWWLNGIGLAGIVYFIGMGVIRTIRGPSQHQEFPQ